MNLLVSFLATSAVKALEQQFASHSPDLRQAFLNEVAAFIKILSDWVESKLTSQGELKDEEKNN